VSRSHGAEPHATAREKLADRAILVQVGFPADEISMGEALEELTALTESAGAEVARAIEQRRRSPDQATFLGRGRVEDLKQACAEEQAAVVVFGHDLTPAQGRNLEREVGVRVVDRSQLILDLFALQARTHQARLQVELAQLQYLLPRLRRMWTHLDRYKGGIGMRGPGETQIETDRREIRRKITELKRKLQGVERHRELHRTRREQRFRVGLLGYTNAGKSTLFNRLTEASVETEDRPFSTLDTRTREWKMGRRCSVLVSDTVGFVRNLPHHLIASFHATLQEALEADLLLHVIDGSREDAAALLTAVEDVLRQIGADQRPRRRVVNKIDAVTDRVLLGQFGEQAIHLSAHSGEGIEELAAEVRAIYQQDFEELDLEIPAHDGARLAAIEAEGEVLFLESQDGVLLLRARLPPALAGRLRDFVSANP
jgi:GTP-binding protein HflX